MNTLICKQIIKGLPPILVDRDVVSLDLELSNLKDGQLHRPFGHLASLACSFDGETVYIIFEEDEVQDFLNRIEKATWIFHNSVFDIGHLRRWATVSECKNMRDIMIIERNMFSNYYDNFALSDLVRRYLSCYMEKETRKEFHELNTAMTPEQINYAALDVIGTWLVDKEQQKIIEQQDFLIWDRIDKADCYTSLSLSGFELDQDGWIKLKDIKQDVVDRIEECLGRKYGKMVDKTSGRGKNKLTTQVFEPFNPASPVQVLEVLKKQKIPVSSTGDDEIRPYIDENEFCKQILEYREAAKKVSTYGLAFLKNVEDDGKIYTSLNVSLAITGRNSSSSPNLQNIPQDKDYRSKFIAGYGKKLVIADYSAQEVRILAYLSSDKMLIEIINSGKDLHCEIARLAFGEIITKKDNPERRNQVKSLIFGLAYGLSPDGFARNNDVAVETAQEMYDKFFDTFIGVKDWYDKTKYTHAEFMRTILGRKIWLHPYSFTRNTLALNCTIQGSAADMTKLAMKKFRKVCQDEIRDGKVGIILPVHDEVIIWCMEEAAEFYKAILRECMIDVAQQIHQGIPAEVDVKIADNWSEK